MATNRPNSEKCVNRFGRSYCNATCTSPVLPSSYAAVTAPSVRIRRLARRVISVRLLEVCVHVIRVQQSQVKRSSDDVGMADEQPETDDEITYASTKTRVR